MHRAPSHRIRPRCPLRARRGGLGGLFEDDVGVGAAETERANPTAAWGVGALPLQGLGRDLHRQVVPGEVRVGLVDMQGLGNAAVLQGEDRLQHTPDPRRALGVSHIGLDRSDNDGMIRISVLTIHRGEGLHLNGVSQRRPGAVTLHIVDA